MSTNELDNIKRNADVLWQEVNKKLQSGVGVPAIELNRVHWTAALQELEILRDALVQARRLQNMLKIKDGRIAGLMHDLYGDGAAHEPAPEQIDLVNTPRDTLAVLDWNRLLSGNYRALDPEHQRIFDTVRWYTAEQTGCADCGLEREHHEDPAEFIPRGTSLADQIAAAQRRIEQWPDDVRAAMGIEPRAAPPPGADDAEAAQAWRLFCELYENTTGVESAAGIRHVRVSLAYSGATKEVRHD